MPSSHHPSSVTPPPSPLPFHHPLCLGSLLATLSSNISQDKGQQSRGVIFGKSKGERLAGKLEELELEFALGALGSTPLILGWVEGSTCKCQSS